MIITKCDLCKKEVERGESVIAGFGFFAKPKAELCLDCGSPILRFLTKNKLIGKEEINKSKIKLS